MGNQKVIIPSAMVNGRAAKKVRSREEEPPDVGGDEANAVFLS